MSASDLEELRRAAAHCFCDDLDAPELAASDHHHLDRVLRLRAGESVTISDGAGSWRTGRFDGKGVEPEGPIRFQPRVEPELTVAFSILKGDRSETATQKLCELGIDVILSFCSERSIPRWDETKAAAHQARLERVAREAAMQSRRVWLPRVEHAGAFRAVVAGGAVALADPDGDPLSLDTPRVMVGPEGGWTEDERASGPPLVCLGRGILRAETAAIAAGTLLTALRAGLVAPPPAP